MIKQLIEDLAYDKITLGQGLTRAKLIASKTQNIAFKEWVNREIQGYGNTDQVPEFRKISCQTSLVIGLPFGAQNVMPVVINDPEVAHYYHQHIVTDSINQIESALRSLTDQINITLQLPGQLALILGQPFQDDIQRQNGGLRAVTKMVGKARYENIIESTKQVLLDTLLELHDQFPNLENEFKATTENIKKVQNIVTNHIHGNNNPINLATGEKVTQKDITNNIGFIDYSRLESLDVQKEEIEHLKEIVETSKGDKSVLNEMGYAGHYWCYVSGTL